MERPAISPGLSKCLPDFALRAALGQAESGSLFKNARGQAARLCHMGHLLMENRHGLIVGTMLTHVTPSRVENNFFLNTPHFPELYASFYLKILKYQINIPV